MVSSEEVKQFASIVVIIYIVYRILDALRHPVNLPNDEEEDLTYVKKNKFCGPRVRSRDRNLGVWSNDRSNRKPYLTSRVKQADSSVQENRVQLPRLQVQNQVLRSMRSKPR